MNLGLGGGLRKAALGFWGGDGEEDDIHGVIKLGGEEGEDKIHRSAFSCTGWLILFSWFLFSRVVGS